ncbi:MAG: SDR family NAD(P)-dependent oxidoreductase, partial [Saprospiraceae bacterium]|nr:SDR family NAD(P)-dependent oxidoreductase [Saprospiraceae bacterium]
MLLKHQTCIITGSSSGIGKGIARKMAMEGANVVINYYSDKEGAEELADDLEQISEDNSIIVVKGDVSSEADVQNIFKQAMAAFKTIDIVIPNSGIQIDAPFDEMTTDAWKRVIDVNLTGQFLVAREGVRQFLKQGP